MSANDPKIEVVKGDTSPKIINTELKVKAVGFHEGKITHVEVFTAENLHDILQIVKDFNAGLWVHPKVTGGFWLRAMDHSMSDAKTITLKECARCGQTHEELVFKQFQYPIQDSDGTTWGWWALCPETGEPILMKLEEDV